MALDKAKKAIFKAKYGDELYELLIKAENVIVGDSESLADRLTTVAESISTIAGGDTGKSVRVIVGEVLAAAGKLERKIVSSVSEIKPSEEGADKYIYMVPKTSAKTGDKYDEYMVIDGAVEKVGSWDVDLADYLQKVSGATAGNFAVFKADGSVEDSQKKPSDFVAAQEGMGLSRNDYSDAEKQKVADAYAAKHSHENKTVLDEIDAAKVASWDGKGKVYVSGTQPQGLQNGDLWLQTFTE